MDERVGRRGPNQNLKREEEEREQSGAPCFGVQVDDGLQAAQHNVIFLMEFVCQCKQNLLLLRI